MWSLKVDMWDVQDSRRHLFQDVELKKYDINLQAAQETEVTSGARFLSTIG